VLLLADLGVARSRASDMDQPTCSVLRANIKLTRIARYDIQPVGPTPGFSCVGHEDKGALKWVRRPR
jgi:hypothetical protein